MNETIKLIESLRSGLAKNSLLAIYEASEMFKKDLDTEVNCSIYNLAR